jgi:anti-anti-sigma factor
VEAQQKFEIEISTSDDATRAVLTVEGEIDVGSAHEIDAVVAVVAGWSETRDVVLELSNVTFIDSSGIAALLRCRKELDKAGIGFSVVGARGLPLTVLEITGVLSYLSVPAPTAEAESA